MSLSAGWRLPIRIARREAMRAKARSILVLVMIALPVAAVTGANVLIHTAAVDSAESLDRRLGTAADALVLASDCGDSITQAIDPLETGWSTTGDSCEPRDTGADVARLAAGRPTLAIREVTVPVRTDRGRTDANGREVDFADPLAKGLSELEDGRWPRTADEVVVNAYLASRGPSLGETLTVADKGSGDFTRKVVGIAESPSIRGGAVIAGLAGSLSTTDADTSETRWLLGGGPVTWDDVLRFNGVRAAVLSRDVVLHPSVAALEADKQFVYSGDEGSTIAVVVLIVVMVLMEVVLLAGPAFAVGARRQSRSLALLIASGGTPHQARKVILATGVVLGLVAGVVGVGLGIVGARLVEPLIQQHNYEWFGPFEIPWVQLFGIGAFGFVSALLAAVVPAWIASRQDVVAVLAGRRGDRKPSAKSPILGLVLFGAGVACAVLGAPLPSDVGAIWIALSAILCVLGMLFLVPVVVVGISKLGRWLPLPVRFAVRDAARHRTRTTPAVAAVAATVAGVVTLGIGMTSDEKENRATYVPTIPMGMATVYAGPDGDWDAYAKTIESELPEARIDRVRGVPYDNNDATWNQVDIAEPGGAPGPFAYGGMFQTNSIVSSELPSYLRDYVGDAADAAASTLAAGGLVVFASEDRAPGDVDVTYRRSNDDGTEDTVGSATLPAVFVNLGDTPPAQAVLSPEAAASVGVPTADVVLLVSGTTITSAAERNIDEGLQGQAEPASLYVERGYQEDDTVLVVQLVLAALGAILMLGGTLTATFLALSDARPDLATLSAVGAAPRTRRAVAAAYALAVGFVGAVLGALVGFVPGIAIAYSATSQSTVACAVGADCAPAADYYLNIPWELIGGLAVLLPLVVAGIVWVSARSKLPLVARLA